MNKPKELPIPPAALDDSQAMEIARIWIANDQQYVSLEPRVWSDPAAWGLMLVDLARHVAAAYQQLEGRDLSHVLERIKEGFDAEWNAPTDEPSGEIMD